MSKRNSPDSHHHGTTQHSPTLSSSSPSILLDAVESLCSRDSTPSTQKRLPINGFISIRKPSSSLRRSVSSYSVDDANYQQHGGSTTSISTISTTAVFAIQHPNIHHHFHGQRDSRVSIRSDDFYPPQRRPSISSAYPLVTGLRLQVDSSLNATTKTVDVSKVTQITYAHHHHHHSTSFSSSSSSRGRFRKFAAKVVKWIRQSVAETKVKSEVRA